MHVTKSLALVYIFHVLLDRKEIRKSEICQDLELNELQFRRYIQDLRAYLITFEPQYELVYKKDRGLYILYEGMDY